MGYRSVIEDVFHLLSGIELALKFLGLCEKVWIPA